MDELKNLAQNLRRLRVGKGLTQEELGLKVGLTKDTISKIELGKQENVGLRYLILICQMLEVDLEQLVTKNIRSIPIVFNVSDNNIQAVGEIVKQIQNIIAKQED